VKLKRPISDSDSTIAGPKDLEEAACSSDEVLAARVRTWLFVPTVERTEDEVVKSNVQKPACVLRLAQA